MLKSVILLLLVIYSLHGHPRPGDNAEECPELNTAYYGHEYYNRKEYIPPTETWLACSQMCSSSAYPNCTHWTWDDMNSPNERRRGFCWLWKGIDSTGSSQYSTSGTAGCGVSTAPSTMSTAIPPESSTPSQSAPSTMSTAVPPESSTSGQSGDDRHVVRVTAKFWYVSDFVGGQEVAEATADNYVEAMNEALNNSRIHIAYSRWGSVQALPQSNDEITMKENYLEIFVNTFGEDLESRRKLKQSADVMIMLSNRLYHGGECKGFSTRVGPGFDEYFWTVGVTGNNPNLFAHEAGHCLGAFHNREAGENGWSWEGTNCGYCLPNTGYATLVSYPWTCPGKASEWIPYFSNPQVAYEGVATGDEKNNNALAMNEKRDNRRDAGNNCLDGNPDEHGNMTYLCHRGEWSDWSDWSECCCESWYQYTGRPDKCWEEKASPISGYYSYSFVDYKIKRTKTRECLNSEGESVNWTACGKEDDEFTNEIVDEKDCDCSGT